MTPSGYLASNTLPPPVLGLLERLERRSTRHDDLPEELTGDPLTCAMYAGLIESSSKPSAGPLNAPRVGSVAAAEMIAAYYEARNPVYWLTCEGRYALASARLIPRHQDHRQGETDVPADVERLDRADDAEQHRRDGAKKERGMPLAEAATRLEALRSQGEPWTSFEVMADRIRTSKSTVFKAVKTTEKLREWSMSRVAVPRAAAMTASVTDRTVDRSSPNPEDVAAVNEFLDREDVSEAEKAAVQAAPIDRQLELIEAIEQQRKELAAESRGRPKQHRRV